MLLCGGVACCVVSQTPGPNTIPYEVQALGSALFEEFASGFYLYQLLIYSAWLWSSWLWPTAG